MPLLKAEHFSFFYPGASSPALSDIDFELRRGEVLFVCGPTGCGKTTLLLSVKREIAPQGKRLGKIYFKGRDMDGMPDAELTGSIGIVFQDAESQTVMDTVLSEMAFALENLGLPSADIRKRVSEVSGFFGLSDLLAKSPHRISGGQRQMVNLCAVLALRPELVLFDEPFSQLDPVAQDALLNMILRANREFGITAVISEHKTEELLPVCDRLLFMEDGKAKYLDTPANAVAAMMEAGDLAALSFMPTPAKIYACAGITGEKAPLDLKEGREFAHRHASLFALAPGADYASGGGGGAALSASNLLFSYPESDRPVIRSLDMTVNKGDFCAILGGNGSGKSTLLKLLSGLLTPQDGRIEAGGKNIRKLRRGELNRAAAYVPQNPAFYFTFDTVAEELEFTGASKTVRDELICALGMEGTLGMHPYDLSGGQRQKLMILCALLLSPDVLLLDEATKGIDAVAKEELSKVLSAFVESGKTVLMASHDIEFCARNAKRFAILFDGALGEFQERRDFFGDSFFYNTALSRMLGDLLPGALTLRDVVIGHG